MEKCKGFTFNNEKNKRELMNIIKKRKKDYNDIKLEVKCGEILIIYIYIYIYICHYNI